MLLVGSNLRDRPQTSMEASSEAALTILIWAPAMLLLVFSSVRSTALSRDDTLVLPLEPRSRLRRSVSVIGAQLAWVTLGWIGIWAGCGFLASRGTTPLYWSMSLNGIAVVTLTSLAGALLAVHRKPAWVAAITAAVSYVGLAIWSYLPDVTGSILFSPYGPLFLVEALPNRHLLEVQLVWALAAVVLLTAWIARLLGTRSAVVLLLVSAVATALTSATMPSVLPRSGTVQLICAPHDGVGVCLWADHEAQRTHITADVDLARALLGAAWQADVVSEGDLAGGPPATLPPSARTADTVVIPVTADPAPREAAARIVVAALKPPTACADLTTAGRFGEPVAVAVERLVISRQVRDSTERLSDQQVAGLIATARPDIVACIRPDF